MGTLRGCFKSYLGCLQLVKVASSAVAICTKISLALLGSASFAAVKVVLVSVMLRLATVTSAIPTRKMSSTLV